jgi:hypothetical protein
MIHFPVIKSRGDKCKLTLDLKSNLFLPLDTYGNSWENQSIQGVIKIHITRESMSLAVEE